MTSTRFIMIDVRQGASVREMHECERQPDGYDDEQDKDADHKRRLAALATEASFRFHVRAWAFRPFAFSTQCPTRCGAAQVYRAVVDGILSFEAPTRVMQAAATVCWVVASVPRKKQGALSLGGCAVYRARKLGTVVIGEVTGTAAPTI